MKQQGLTWADWAKTYPARKVENLPNHQDAEIFDDYINAVSYKNYLEDMHDRGGFEIVEYEMKFYIIDKE